MHPVHVYGHKLALLHVWNGGIFLAFLANQTEHYNCLCVPVVQSRVLSPSYFWDDRTLILMILALKEARHLRSLLPLKLKSKTCGCDQTWWWSVHTFSQQIWETNYQRMQNIGFSLTKTVALSCEEQSLRQGFPSQIIPVKYYQRLNARARQTNFTSIDSLSTIRLGAVHIPLHLPWTEGREGWGEWLLVSRVLLSLLA